MITPRHHADHGSADHDPTGVRRLLSSLPDPGPMPPELVDRITASLAAEQQRRADTSPPAPNVAALHRPSEPAARRGAGMAPPTRTSRGARPRRSRTLLALGGAAATVAAVTVVGANLTDQPTVPVAVTPPADVGGSIDQGQSDGTVPDGAPEGGVPPAPDGQPLPPGLERLESLHIQQSDTRYTAQDFSEQAARLETSTGRHVESLPLTPQELGPASTRSGLLRCLSGLGRELPSDPDRVTADFATFEGRPAVIVLVVSGSESQAWAMGRDCGHGMASVLVGPADAG